MSDELKKCLSCGNDVAVISEGMGEYWGFCSVCGTSTAMCHSRKLARLAWNRRVEQKPYNPYDFCKSKNCIEASRGCDIETADCLVSEFIKWADEKNARIVED